MTKYIYKTWTERDEENVIERWENTNKCYLLCICFWFKCDEPVVVVGKFTVDELGKVVPFKKSLNLLGKKNKKTQQQEKRSLHEVILLVKR